jgi:hypothetical protein
MVLTGCGGGSQPPDQELAAYRSHGYPGLSFRYPTSWAARQFHDQSTIRPTFVNLSNQPMHDPCHPYRQGTRCGPTIDELEPGGVYLEWREAALIGPGDGPGSSLSVDGVPGRLDIHHESCDGLGGDEWMALSLRNGIELSACFAGPDTSATEAQVRALIASTRFARR